MPDRQPQSRCDLVPVALETIYPQPSLILGDPTREIMGALSELRDQGLHVVERPRGKGDEVVPERSVAVLLLAEAPQDAEALQLVERLRRASQCPPLVVMLLWHAGSARENSGLAEAYRSFTAVDADDVIVQPSMEDLPDVVLLAVERAALRRQQMKKHVEGSVRRGAEKVPWASVQMIFEGFPVLDGDMLDGPQVGRQVGARALLEVIGKGQFTEVYRAMNTETQQVEAVKVVPKTTIDSLQKVEHFWNEIQISSRLCHPNVIKLHDCAHGRHHMYIFMELADAGSLACLIQESGGRLATRRVEILLQQFSPALAYLHANGVAIRNLKPEAILIAAEDDRALLANFGLAVAYVRGVPLCDYDGTMPFIAPEVLRREPHDAAAADVWSLGVVLLEMLFGLGALGDALDWQPDVRGSRSHAADLQAFIGAVPPEGLGHRFAAQLVASPPPPSLRAPLSGALALDPGVRWPAELIVPRGEAEACSARQP